MPTRTILLILWALTSATATQQQKPANKPVLGGSPRVSPDGSRILIASNRSGTSQLYSMRPDGTDARQLTSDSAGVHSGNWAPDGRRIVYTAGTQIIVVEADGSGRRVVTDAKGNQTPSWSPDGTMIVFSAGEFPSLTIHTMRADGADRRSIATSPGFDYDPVWSPDGKAIAFVGAVRGQGARLYLMSASGSERRRLTNLELAEERPAWSPDGKYIAFQASSRTAGVSEADIYVAEVTSGATRRVTNHRRPMLDETPSWFPDGRRLAIQSDRDATWSTYVIDLDGATTARLTRPVTYYNPRWSPDGRTLVFESTRDGKYAVYTVGVDGSGLAKLTSDESNSEQPNWSTDGTRIVFTSDRDGHGQLYLMNADGSNQRRLTNTTGGGVYGARFSPDGQWIVFQGRPDNALVNEIVYVIGADGTGWRSLTDPAFNSVGPRWTKDGRITFTQSRYGVRLWSEMTPAEMEKGKQTEVTVTIRPDGSGLTRSPRPVPPRCCEAWTKDWKTVFFKSKRDGAESVYAMDADESNLRRVADGEAVPDPNVAPDGRLFAYERNDGDTWGIYVFDIATGRERALAGGRVQVIPGR